MPRTLVAFGSLPLVAGNHRDFDVDIGSILGYLLVGLIVGVIARFLVPGRDPLGLLGTLIVGVIGAVLGGWLAGAVFPETEGVDWIASILAAIVLVLLARAAGVGRTGWSRFR